MIGCYAQTELGHGSNIRALETTATFVKNEATNGGGGDDQLGDGEWIINSPTITSTKFWPGTLGKTANHAMIIAQLIDGDGIERGIHNFIVPLRSMKDHTLLPGVMTGDIGPKIGYNNMDNGYATFIMYESHVGIWQCDLHQWMNMANTIPRKRVEVVMMLLVRSRTLP
jgi:acyl-CoA oxidase